MGTCVLLWRPVMRRGHGRAPETAEEGAMRWDNLADDSRPVR